MLTRRMFLRSAAGAMALGSGAAAYAVAVEPLYRLQVSPFTVAHPSWPASMPPLRIAVLTDIHAVEPWMPVERIARIVEVANGLGADMVVLLGDYVAAIPHFTSALVPFADWAGALRGLKAPLGVYAIMGNHDWWTDNWKVRDHLTKVGIPVLENRAIKVDRDGRRFWVAGLGDQMALHVPGGYRGVDDLPGLVKQVMSDRDPVILLAHEPDVFVRVPERVALTLSGHTHGGQIKLPLIGRPVIPSRFGQRYAYGHIVEGGRSLVVSAGLGVTGLPVRFGVPPEIALVTLGAPGQVDAAG
jgi:predicted MPP superfamily phosphohydrolase